MELTNSKSEENIQGFKYVAFISYQRNDEEWAKWLQHQLEHYHLPTDLCDGNHENYIDIPDSSKAHYVEPIDIHDIKRLRPVFLDETELAGGNLNDEINKALANSRYLIVVCSPNSAKSKWVNKEVQTFIDNSQTSRIIPFIIDGIPYSGDDDTECYVPALCKLRHTKNERLGINATSEKEKASVKLVAQILGVSFDSLWRRYDREKELERAKALEEKRSFQKLESRLLCKKAEACLNSGDLYNSYINALQALPINLNDDTDRPYIWEAENILRKILHTDVNYPESYSKPLPTNQWITSYNGKLTATADGNSGNILLWNNDSKSLIKELPGYIGKLSALQFNSDGSLLLTASKTSNSISLISIDTGIACWAVEAENPIYANFSPDESLIILVSSDNVISILETGSGKCLESIVIGTSDNIKEIFPFPEISKGNRFVTCRIIKEYEKEVFNGPLEGYDYYTIEEYDLLIWDISEHKEYWYRGFPQGSLRIARISNDEKYKLIVLGNGTVGIAGIKQEKFRRIYDSAEKITSLYFSTDCNYAKFITEKDKDIIYNLTTGEVIDGIESTKIKFPERHIPSQPSEEEVFAYFQNNIKECHILHRINCEPDPYFHSNDPIQVQMSTKGSVAAVFSNPKQIALWNNCQENNYITLKGNYGHILKIEFSNDGKKLLSVGEDGNVLIWNIENGECIEKISLNDNRLCSNNESSPITVKFSNDNRYLIFIHQMKYDVWSINEKAYTARNLLNDPFNTNVYVDDDGNIICNQMPVKIDPDFDTYCISPNNKLFALISDNNLIIYDIANGTILSTKECDGIRIKSICFSSDSQFVVSSETSRICVWNINEDGPVRVIEDNRENFKDARLCNTNNMLYTCSNEKIIFWEHKPLQQLMDYLRTKFNKS